ncbi:AGE family epimerase/isomerase [Eleftheria terrae]|uniref:AGE family epimerase/isomerase n=1 Tax=Eleftheria terrae TaxID=1597781 RepID=UPI00263B1FBB|nr:AGE family epimerase/isomerase [Eleftheria terrae]WKB50988.1 AGE family epimerase/isomerase [Eleftheria terrae]
MFLAAGAALAGPVDGADALPDGAVWLRHAEDDLLRYWRAPGAQGQPVGRFPTFRCLDGRPYDARQPCAELAGAPGWLREELGRDYVRMQARQVFAYAMGFHLNGDPALLRLAGAGVEDIRARALDPHSGSAATYYDAGGRPQPAVGERTVQDLAYAGLALAAWHYLTGDAGTLADLDRLHRHLMRHYDPRQGQMRWTLQGPGAQRGELVAQLDPLNAYMVLTLPRLQGEQRARWQADMRRLLRAIRTRYCGVPAPRCVGTLDAGGAQPGARHNDFGHSGKAFWMVMLAGRQLGDAQAQRWARRQARALLRQAWLDDSGSWASAWTADGVDAGKSWWIHAELDQLAATLALDEPGPDRYLVRSWPYWLRHFVDHDGGEVHGGLSAEGAPPPVSLKQHHWKNGYHSLEHALISYITTQALRGEPVQLHFAPVSGAAGASVAQRPYLFDGQPGLRESRERDGITVVKAGFSLPARQVPRGVASP